MTTAEWDRVPVVITLRRAKQMVETYGFAGSQGQTVLEGQRLVPRGGRPTPCSCSCIRRRRCNCCRCRRRSPMPGLHVLCAGSRYAKNDSALIMEKVAYDLGAILRHARETLGYRKVVLVGWSGGGSLSLFYQAQAERPTITHTPAGDPYDLTAADLSPADGIIFIAAHLSRAETLTEWIDPSVRDELRSRTIATSRSTSTMPNCPNKPPFSADFVAAFRAAQRARNRRSPTGRSTCSIRLKRRNDGEMERAFVVHRTMSDVRWIDADDRSERAQAELVLPRRSAHRELGAGRARALFLAALVAVAMVVREVERQGTGQRRAGEEDAGAADRQPGRRRGAGDAQSGDPRRARHQG